LKIFTSREIIKILVQDGWYEYGQDGSHKHFKHKSKSGKVTVPDHGGEDLKIGTSKSILKQAGITLE